MMVIRPVEPGDLPRLLKLAAETGGGLTSLPVDEADPRGADRPLAADLARRATGSEQGYVFVLRRAKRRGGGHLRDRGGGGAQRSLV